jgi:transcriptional regulator with XRE-family HTH domain
MDQIIYNRISVAIFDARIDQKDLAKILNVTENTVSRWCKNIHQPSLQELRRISMVLRIDVRLLIEPTDWSKETGLSQVEIFKAKKMEAKATKKKKPAKKKRRR